jgi:hypothetical protein
MIKVTKDNFVWKIVTHKAKEILASGVFELYVLYDDDTEYLIEDLEDLNLLLEEGRDIGIEVGQINFYFKTYGIK